MAICVPEGSAMAKRLDFKVLGPLEATAGGESLELGPHQQRAVLALLLANANRVVSIDRVIDALWGEEGVDKEKTVWVYISRLRTVLEPERTGRGESTVLLTKEPGYVLSVDPDQVDYLRFEDAVVQARAVLDGDPDRAVEILDHALGLWHGEPFADLAYETFLRNDADRLIETRLEAAELRFEALLQSGQSTELISDLEVFVRDNPYREMPVGQLMVALYRAGRQAEALRAYERHRRTMADELGVNPSPALNRIEEQILLHDPSLVPHRRAATRLLTAPSQANPYKGLHAFSESDESTFYGRDALVAELLRRIDHGDRLVAVVGPSGSGKSSVVRAGLIPRVRKVRAPSGEDWVVAQMVPGAHPFIELEAALLKARLDGPDSVAEQLMSGDTAVLRAGLRVLQDSDSRLLLVIDQFEELFTLVDDRAERERFLRALLVALDDPHGRITVVLTLRADFYDRPLLHPDFGRRLGDAVVNVTPLTPQELEDAALKPAQAAGVAVEPRLLGRLLGDVVGEPGALPMFQYALTELYDRQAAGVMLESAYEKMGGLGGAISNRAEGLFADLDPAEQAAGRQLFLRLVTMSGEETWSRRRVKAAEIISLDVDVIALQAVIDRFAAHRLLLFDRDKVSGAPTVEVGHEALLYEWHRLEEWIRHARRDLLRHAALRAAVDEWERSGRDSGYLLTGSRLAETAGASASGAVQLNARELEYLDASLAAQDEEKRVEEQRQATEAKLASSAQRRLWSLVALLGVAAVVVVGVLFAGGGPAVRAAFIHTGDTVATDLTVSGLEEAERRFDMVFDVITPPWVSVEETVRTQLEGGADLIVIDNALWSQGDMWGLVDEWPDANFLVFNNFESPVPNNLLGLIFAEPHSAYLAGVAAAMETQTGVVGVIGAYPVNIVDDDIDGFRSGVHSVAPDVEVLVDYVGEEPDDLYVGESDELWSRPDLGREVALAMYADGADVIFHAAGDSGLGIFQAAWETTESTGVHVWGIGSGSDQAFDVPADQADHVLMSTVRRFDTAVIAAVERISDGTFNRNERLLTLGNGGIDVTTTGDHLAASTLEAMAAARQALIAGDAKIESERPEWVRPEVIPCGPDESGYGLAAGCRLLTVSHTPWPSVPFKDFDDDENLIGFEADVINEIAGRLDLEVQFVNDPFEYLIADVSIGRYDVALNRLDITEQRAKVVDFSEPHAVNPAVLVVRRDSGIETIDDVTTVVVRTGTSFQDLMERDYPEKTLILLDGFFEQADMVARGDADAWVTQLDLNLLDDEVLVVAETLADQFTAFAINPRLAGLKADMDRALAGMLADGTYAEIYERWFDTDLARVDGR